MTLSFDDRIRIQRGFVIAVNIAVSLYLAFVGQWWQFFVWNAIQFFNGLESWSVFFSPKNSGIGQMLFWWRIVVIPLTLLFFAFLVGGRWPEAAINLCWFAGVHLVGKVLRKIMIKKE